MPTSKDLGVSRRFMSIALAVLVLIYVVRLMPRDAVIDKTKSLLDAARPTAATSNDDDSDSNGPHVRIRDKVAMISDTQYSPRLIPLLLHFHTVMGPGWPIVFYTSQETAERTLYNQTTSSAVFQRAVARGAIEVRIIPDEYNMTSREGVNIYLSRPWLWEQLAPAEYVLVFQTDAMLCGNAHRTLDDFLEWDFIGAPLNTQRKVYNGGLSLRNRTMMMEILRESPGWKAEIAAGDWAATEGEDIWFSHKIEKHGGRLPDLATALTFACQHDWHISHQKNSLGYHKVHKNAGKRLDEITQWCPEIALAAPGALAQ